MKKNTKSFAWGIFWFLVLTAADQLSKMAVSVFLKGRGNLPLIPGIFELYYLENRGAAFGIMRGKQALLSVVALVIILYIGLVYRKIPQGKRYVPLKVICVMTASGAFGNVADRLIRGYVVDFLYFSLIDFPVFNLADCYVSIGVVMMTLLLFTYYKDEPFGFLNPFRRRE